MVTKQLFDEGGHVMGVRFRQPGIYDFRGMVTGSIKHTFFF